MYYGDKDKKIINALFENGRASVSEIEKRTRIRRDSVARRLKKMMRDEVIMGFVPVVNPKALGVSSISIFLIRTKTGEDLKKKRFLNKLICNANVVHISKLIGKYDFYCSILYRDTKHLNDIVEAIKNYVPNYVEDFELYQVADDPKFEDMRGLLYDKT